MSKDEGERLYKSGVEDLKTSVFKLKFSPDYVSAVSNFEKSAKIFSDLKLFEKALQSYFKAIECNKKLLESWGEGTNMLKVSEIYFFQKQDFKNGFKYLDEAQISFKLAGKYHTYLKILTDLAQKLQETAENNKVLEYYDVSLKVLQNAWNDLTQHLENDMMKISMDGLYSKLLDNYLVDTTKIQLALQLTKQYIDIIRKIKDVKKHKIINSFAKLLMLRLINKEINVCDDIIAQSRGLADSSTLEDVNDLEVLLKSFKEKNQKGYNYQITYCYHLFEKNLIKQLKKAFDDYANFGSKSEDFLGESEYDKKQLEISKDKQKEEDNPDNYL